MQTGWLCGTGLLLFFLVLVCVRRWAYICVCAAMEGGWVCIAYIYGILALETNDGGLLFWAIAGLAYSAVELCLCLYTFILLADMRGHAHS